MREFSVLGGVNVVAIENDVIAMLGADQPHDVGFGALVHSMPMKRR